MRALVALALVAALAFPAAADGCVPTTQAFPLLTVHALGEGVYIDADPCVGGCETTVWFYQESNGIAGLQRQDAVVDDTCGGAIDGDTSVL
ncbi:MAG TPA: hypothetical protein VM370_02115 [Candidatus Thermoplasmatota archaeon]|nr:hypothetical protein [Candidatus Thermoplasmatota archaeon]